MTATERLRQLLDERGVEWERPVDSHGIIGTFWWDSNNDQCSALEGADDIPIGKLSVQANLTPEQAVDATLGREPNDKEMLRLHDRLNVALLRLERNVDNGNERIAAIAEAHELLEDAATLGRGTCEDELREALTDLWPRASFTMCPENRESWLERLAELGVEVDA